MKDRAPAPLTDRLLTAVVALVVAGTALLFGFGLYDGTLAIRTIPAQVSCRSQGLVPVRRQLSSRIRCAPEADRSGDELAPQATE